MRAPRFADAMSAIEPDPYGLMVDFYDQWSAHMVDDVEFYVRRAREAGGPVVELGVGTGRVAIPTAKAGVEMIGVDRSDAMLTECRRRAGVEGVGDMMTLLHADMRTFVADPPVRLVTIPFRAFLHNLTIEDQLATLTSAHRSLRPGGRLAMNVFTPDPAIIVAHEGTRSLHAEYRDDNGRRCEVWARTTHALARQQVNVDITLEVYDGDRVADSTESGFTLHLLYPFELEHLLARTGFELEACYGGFDERPYGPGPDEMVVIARKPDEPSTH